MSTWKHRPWKPSLDTVEAWRSFALSSAALFLATVLLWLML